MPTRYKGCILLAPLAETPRFPLRLPTDLRKQLEEIATAEHRTLSNLILYIVREWLAGRGRRA